MDLLQKYKEILSGGAKKLSSYFDASSNAGNNFWGSKPMQTFGQGMQNIQNAGGVKNIISPQKFTSFLQGGGQTINNFLPKPVQQYTKPITQMAINTAGNVGSGVFKTFTGGLDIGKGVMERKPITALSGVANIAYGIPQVTLSGNKLFQVPNLISSLPQIGKGDELRRLSSGFLSGITQEAVNPNVPSQNINIAGNEFDPLKMVGSMVGFVKNPTNSKLYDTTSKLFQTGKYTNLLAKGVITGFKGGVEGFVQGLSTLPVNVSDDELRNYILQQIGFGAGSELAFKGAGYLGKQVMNNANIDQLINPIVKNAKDWIRMMNIPVGTMEIDPKTGERITIPMWKYQMGNLSVGNTVKDINKLSVEDYAKVKPVAQGGVGDVAGDIGYTKAMEKAYPKQNKAITIDTSEIIRPPKGFDADGQPLIEKQIQETMRNFDPKRAQITVTRNANGKLQIENGAHTLEAMDRLGIKKVNAIESLNPITGVPKSFSQPQTGGVGTTQADIQSTYGKLLAEGNPKRIADFEKKYMGETTMETSGIQNRKVAGKAEIPTKVSPLELQKPNTTLPSQPIIPPSSRTPKPEEVAATLPGRIDSFIQKTLGYSTEAPTGGTKQANAWTRTLRGGQEALSTKIESGLGSENNLVRNAASTLQNFFRGLGMSPERANASMELRGGIGIANDRAYNVMDSLYKVLKQDKGSLERINAVLDPELAKTKVSFADLTPVEKQVYGIIREGLDLVHDTSYANGRISPELYIKNKGKYTPRMYDVFEMPVEISDFVRGGKKIDNNLYKERTDPNAWKIENSLNDPVYGLGKRLAQVETNGAIKKYTDFLANNPRFVSDVERPGFVKLSDSPAYGSLSGKYVLNSAAEDLKGFFFANESMQNLYDVFRAYDRLGIRQLQKKLLTVFNPTTNVGNIVSDQVFGFVTGVDPLTLNKNLLEFRSNPAKFRQLSDYLMKKGIIGTDITRTDFVNKLGQIDELAQGKTAGKLESTANKVQSFYGGTDDVYKASAFKALLDKGYSLEEATRKVSDGFQNYANVGKFYDVWAKTPVVGSAFIKFQGDLMRIIKNGAINNPLGLITFLGTLWGVARLSSKLSGESDQDRQTRENRFAAPMIPGLNIPLTWQTPMGEINAARYISPFYANNETTSVTKMFPFMPNIQPNKDVASNIAMNANDPLLSTPVQLLVNRDFRGKNISSPDENKYQPSTLTPSEKLMNQATFGVRSYLPPPVNSAIDVASVASGGKDMYGRTQTVPQSIARLGGIKITQFGAKEAEQQRQNDAEYEQMGNESVQKQINAVTKQQLKGEITPEQATNRINNLQQQMKAVGLPGTTTGGEVKYIDKNGSLQTIDLSEQLIPPVLTGSTELDKLRMSKYRGSLTTRENDIVKLWELSSEGKIKPGQAGYTTQDDAEKVIKEMESLKTQYAAPKAKKISIKKLSVKKVKAYKVPKIKIPKLKKAKVYKLKQIKLSKIKLKRSLT